MCGNFPNIKVVEGNAFSLVLPLKRRTFESCQPIDEDIDATQLTDVVVKFGGVEYTPSLGVDGVTIILPATLARGTYDIVLTAKYQGTDIRAAYESAISIVPWNSQSDAQQFVPGSPIVCDAAYVIGGALTDAELEALKEQYREAIADAQQAQADAEAAKEHYDQLAEQLTGVAQEQTLTDGVTAIRDDISHIDIDTSDLAKQGTNPNATNTAILTAAQNAGADTQAVAQSYDILQAKGVQIPEHTADRTAQNLPATINQINPAFVGKAYLSTATTSQTFTEVEYNFSKIVFYGNLNSLLSRNSYVEKIVGLYSTHELYSILSALQYCYALQYIDLSTLDVSGVTTAYSTLYNCSSLKKLDMHGLNFSSITDFREFARICYTLYWVDASNTKINSNNPNMSLFFGSNTNLETLVGDHTIEEVVNENICVFEGWNVAFAWNMSGLLNRASLRAIINGLADRTGQSALTITFGATNLARLTADDIAIATNKNWTLA